MFKKKSENEIIIEQYSIPYKGNELIRANHTIEDQLLEYYFEGTKTLHEMFMRGVSISGNKPCCGWRLGPNLPYTWFTYNQVLERSKWVGSGLIALGAKPRPSQCVGIISGNRIEWVLVEQACNCYSMVTVPIPKSNLKFLESIVQLCNLTILIVDTVSFAKDILTYIMNMHFFVKLIVVMEKLETEMIQLGKSFNVKIIEFTALEFVGTIYVKELVPPKTNDLNSIRFTSGTTGTPKGVMITHKNLVSSISSLYAYFAKVGVKVSNTSVAISYYPVSSIVEEFTLYATFCQGARVGFYSGDRTKLFEDLQELKPTLFPLPPKFLCNFYELEMTKIQKSTIKSYLFKTAMKAKTKLLHRGIITKHTIWDYTVFKKYRKKFGGKIKCLFIGGAGLSTDAVNFLKCALGVNVQCVYGITETSGLVTMAYPLDMFPGSVGPPHSSSLVKLIDAPEQKYFVENGFGEICVKGPNVFSGYYKNETLTKAVLDEDGWYHTGDIGTWLKNGSLKIIDRRKNIFVLSNGEQIFPEKIESVFREMPVIDQIFVYGDDKHDFAVAIVEPNVSLLKALCQERNDFESFRSLCDNQAVVKWVLNEMKKRGKVNQLKPYEIPKKITLTEESFTIENDLLTVTSKPKRGQIYAKFKTQIDNMFG